MPVTDRGIQWKIMLGAAACLLVAAVLAYFLLTGQALVEAGRISAAVLLSLSLLSLVGSFFAYGQPERWLVWLGWFVMTLVIRSAFGIVLLFYDYTGLGLFVLAVGAGIELTILIRGLSLVPRVRLIGLTFVGALEALSLAAVLNWSGPETNQAMVTGLLGFTAMGLTFLLGHWLLKWLLSWPMPVFAVARSVLDEAIRMKVAMVFVILLLLSLAMLPSAVGEDHVDYQVQRFLAYSMMAVAFFLGIMTIFLGCSSVARDLSQKQIFLTMSKPISRAQYLLGKWLGLAALNLLLVTMCGGAIYTFTMVFRASEKPDSRWLAELDNFVLVARESKLPEPQDPAVIDQLIEQREKQYLADNTQQAADGTIQQPVITPRLIDEFRGAAYSKWQTLKPLEEKTFVFSGLDYARKEGGYIQLRFKPSRSSDLPEETQQQMRMMGFSTEYVVLLPQINGEPVALPHPVYPQLYPQVYTPVLAMANRTVRTIELPVYPEEVGRAIRSDLSEESDQKAERISPLIDNEGKMRLTLKNFSASSAGGNGTVSFKRGEEFELLIPVGSFEGNLFRAMLINWMQLCLLSTVGIMAGTFLSFPVACMLTFLVFAAGLLSSYVTEALRFYGNLPSDDLPAWDWILSLLGYFWNETGSRILNDNYEGFKPDEVLQTIVALFAKITVSLLPQLSVYDPTDKIANGRVITWSRTFDAGLWMMVIWNGAACLVGWLAFRKRELAQVQV